MRIKKCSSKNLRNIWNLNNYDELIDISKLFDEMSTATVRYHKVACYQDLLDAMTAIR